MARRKSQSIGKTIAAVILILLLLALVGGLVMYLKNIISKDDIMDIFSPRFRVECNGQSYYVDSDNLITLPSKGRLCFKVKNVESVSIDVVPLADCEYTVNGESHRLSEHKSLSQAFLYRDDVYADHIYLDCDKHQFDLQSVLQVIYGDEAQIDLVDIPIAWAKIVFTSSEGVVEIAIQIHNVSGVGLDKSAVVF